MPRNAAQLCARAVRAALLACALKGLIRECHSRCGVWLGKDLLAQAKMLRSLQAPQAALAAGYYYPDLKADLSAAIFMYFARSGVAERLAPMPTSRRR
jgi:hypothetical protein